MRVTGRIAALLPALALIACHGGGNPVGPPFPGEVHSLEVVVFYDEDGDGQLGADELGRVPGVAVSVAGRNAQSARATGQATLTGLPGGRQTLTVRADSLPPFYVPPQPSTLDIPANAIVGVPLGLPVGGNVRNRYMAFGDSITVGDGATGGLGYPPLLEDLLRQHFGVGELVNEGVDGTRTDGGAARIGDSLSRQRPSFTLIHYGTNDWNKCKTPEVCNPVSAEYLRSMVQQVEAAGSLPVLATVIPVNVGYNESAPPQRNEYVESLDRLIREVATQEGALLVDLEAAFYRAAGQDLSPLFWDHVHPNDRGYEIMAEEFFKALSSPAGGAAPSVAFDGPAPWILPPAPSRGLRPAVPHQERGHQPPRKELQG